MVLENFLVLCAFLLVFVTIVGIVMLFWWLDEMDKKCREQKLEKFKRELMQELRREIHANMESHWCNCHCSENIKTEV